MSESQRISLRRLIESGVLVIGDGYRAKNDELGGDGPIFLRAGHVTDAGIDLAGAEHFKAERVAAVQSKLSRAGDVIVTTKGWSTGRVAFIGAEMPPLVYSPHLSFWRSVRPDVLDPMFLRQWSRSPQCQRQIDSVKLRIDIHPYLSLDTQRDLEIDVPPLADQQAIGAVLGALDDKIDLNRRVNETLEETARALFKSWFVDFDPVRAKAEGRQPFGMDATTAALLPDSFEDSELGDVPKGWRFGCVGDITTFHNAKRVPLSAREREARRGPFPYYGAAGLVDHVDGFLFDGEFVLVGEDGSVVNDDGTPVTQHVWGKFWVNNHAHVLTGASGVPLEWLLLAMRSLDVRPYVTGAVQPKLSQGRLRECRSIVPTQGPLRAFTHYCRPLFMRRRFAHEESAHLTELRDYLLPKLLSGEVRVRDAEKLVGEAT